MGKAKRAHQYRPRLKMVGTLRFAHPTKSASSSATRSPNLKPPAARFAAVTSGEGLLIVSTVAAQRRALFIVALTLLLGVSGFITKARAAGAFAVGKCGAYGQAYDYPAEAAARAAALKQCKGNCTAVTMKRACAAFAVDYGQSLRRPRLCGEAQDIEFAQRRDKEVLRIRRQGMRDPRLGLRRQGVILLSSFRGAR